MGFLTKTNITYLKIATIYILSTLYVIIGIKHFIDLDFFLAIMPPYIPLHKECVYISGLCEIVFGILMLFNKTRKVGAWGIILLLIAVFPANIYLYSSEIAQEALQISKTKALIRMPFQIPLIIIAYWHSLKEDNKQISYISLILFLPTILYFITL